MTRERAIEILQKRKAEYLDEWVDYSSTAEAYDMAIKALEQVPNENCIVVDKSALKDYIWKLLICCGSVNLTPEDMDKITNDWMVYITEWSVMKNEENK